MYQKDTVYDEFLNNECEQLVTAALLEYDNILKTQWIYIYRKVS